MHRIRRAKTHINGIRIVNERLCLRFGNVFCDVAAHLVGEGKLSIRKCACARPAAHDGAGRAPHAFARDARGAFALGNSPTAVHQQDFFACIVLHQLKRGENARRACADDDRIIELVHGFFLLP